MDYTPKQAAHYLYNFTTILADNGKLHTPGKMNYSIQDQPGTVHDLLLQKSNGSFFLVLWGERFSGASDTITIHLSKTYQLVSLYDPTLGTSPIVIKRDVDSIVLEMTDHPVIIEVEN